MANYYYLDENNNEHGLKSIEQLLQAGITPQTKVWSDGLPEWTDAINVPEIAKYLNNEGATPASTQDSTLLDDRDKPKKLAMARYFIHGVMLLASWYYVNSICLAC